MRGAPPVGAVSTDVFLTAFEHRLDHPRPAVPARPTENMTRAWLPEYNTVPQGLGTCRAHYIHHFPPRFMLYVNRIQVLIL